MSAAPMENIWQFVCNNRLSNCVLTSYDNIVDHCCEAWNKLAEQPGYITTIEAANGCMDHALCELV